MTNLVESIALDGTEVTLTLRPPIHPDWQALVAAASVRVLEFYPVFNNIVFKWGESRFSTSRAHVEQMLRPDGFAAIADRGRWQEIVNRLVLEPFGK
jgi:hypothetical protein